MSTGTTDGTRALHDLVTAAKARPEMIDTAPGGLGQIVAAVQYAMANRPIREGSPHTLASRVQRLRTWMDAHPEIDDK